MLAGLAKAEAPALQAYAASAAWQRVLFYTPHWLGSHGLAFGPGFYLAADGDRDPLSELQATIAALRQGPESFANAPDQHPRCRYPRRVAALKEALPELMQDLPPLACPAYHEWRANFPVRGASLVYSANYLNNPASMYGHTLLRLSRGDGSAHQSSALHDYAVNFAANPDTGNALLYSLYGLTGRFFGSFSLMPYYLKVQEYNNAESRDLWEYPLRFNAAEIEQLMATLWEVGPQNIRYWYLDENCSLVLLALLSAAKTDLDVTSNFLGVVTPKDTVLALAHAGMLAEPVLRLSAYGRLQQRRRDLNPDESAVFAQITAAKHFPLSLQALPASSQRQVLDAILEWIAYAEKLAGPNIPKQYTELWQSALARRAALAAPSPPLRPKQRPLYRPDVGNTAQSLAAGFLTRQHGGETWNLAILNLRLALHSLLQASLGYADDQEITMGDFRLGLERDLQGQTKARLLLAEWLHILSIPDWDSLTAAKAWTLGLSTTSELPPSRPWLRHALKGGIGAAWHIHDLRAFVIPIAILGRLDRDQDHPVALAFGLRSGVFSEFSARWRLGLQLEAERGVEREAKLKTWSKLSGSWTPLGGHEFQLGLDLDPHKAMALSMLWRYYL